MQNECVPLFRGGQPDLSGRATAPIVAGTFVAIAGTPTSGPGLNTSTDGSDLQIVTATAAGDSLGVAATDATTGALIPVLRPGNVVPMIANGAITAGQRVEVGTGGKPRVLASGIARGKATTTAADTATVYIEII